MRRELLQAACAALPERLNRGILMGEGGPCILGWLWLVTGNHPISIYAGIETIAHPRIGGPAIEVIARLYGLDPGVVAALKRANDDAPPAERSATVRRILEQILADPSHGTTPDGAHPTRSTA